MWPVTDRDAAARMLAAQLAQRAELIADELGPDEAVQDCGEVDELHSEAEWSQFLGGALLYITDRRLILYNGGNVESWPYAEFERFMISNAPSEVPLRSEFRRLTLRLAGSEERTLIGGFMFLAEVQLALLRQLSPTNPITETSKSDRHRHVWIGQRADALISEGMAIGQAYERASQEYSHAGGQPIDEQVITEAKKLMEKYGFSSEDALARAARSVSRRR